MMTRTRFLAFLLCLWACSAFSPAEKPTLSQAEWQAEMLSRVNALRAKGCSCGRRYMPPAPPLQLNRQLSRVAQAHAEDMKQRDYFNHVNPEGESVAERATRAGYRWANIGENIGWNYRNVSQMVQGWRESPGHCRNMMNGNYTELGVGIAGDYYVQVLGRAR